MKLNLSSRSKGINFSIKTIAVMALGIMMVVLLYTSFETWFSHVTSEFLETLAFDSGN